MSYGKRAQDLRKGLPGPWWRRDKCCRVMFGYTFVIYFCSQIRDIQYSEDTSKDEGHSTDHERKILRGVTCAPKGAPMPNECDDCPYYSAALNICEEQFPSLTLDASCRNSRYGTNPRTNVSAKANKERGLLSREMLGFFDTRTWMVRWHHSRRSIYRLSSDRGCWPAAEVIISPVFWMCRGHQGKETHNDTDYEKSDKDDVRKNDKLVSEIEPRRRCKKKQNSWLTAYRYRLLLLRLVCLFG